MKTNQQFFSAKEIARIAGVSAKTIHRRARREGWPFRPSGNRREYCPPARSRPEDRAKAVPVDISASQRTQNRRAWLRYEALLELARLKQAGKGREEALTHVTAAFRFHISPTALRRWEQAYMKAGFQGLFEQKIGRVGRKPLGNNNRSMNL